jgi:hypothetical protein
MKKKNVRIKKKYGSAKLKLTPAQGRALAAKIKALADAKRESA